MWEPLRGCSAQTSLSRSGATSPYSSVVCLRSVYLTRDFKRKDWRLLFLSSVHQSPVTTTVCNRLVLFSERLEQLYESLFTQNSATSPWVQGEQGLPSHTLSVSYTPLGACCWELCARDVWHGVLGLTSMSSAAAADSRRRGLLCAATPESAGCASEETGWEETGRSRATAAASPAPCWAWVMDRQHVICSACASCCESWFASRSILAQRHMGGWLYFTSTSESTSNFSFFVLFVLPTVEIKK